MLDIEGRSKIHTLYFFACAYKTVCAFEKQAVPYKRACGSDGELVDLVADVGNGGAHFA